MDYNMDLFVSLELVRLGQGETFEFIGGKKMMGGSLFGSNQEEQQRSLGKIFHKSGTKIESWKGRSWLSSK